MKTLLAHLQQATCKIPFPFFAAVIVMAAVALPATTARAQTQNDVVFDIAAGGTSHLTVNGAAINVAVAGGRVTLDVLDTPCKPEPDSGALFCDYQINSLFLRLTNFTASGTTFSNGVVQLTNPTKVVAIDGVITLPVNTSMAFGATVSGTRRYRIENSPSKITLSFNLAAQTASVSASFVGTMLGRSINGSVVANAVSPFVNLPPIANAGPDKTVQGRGPFVPVPLSGTATDPRGGSVLSADWRENGNVIAQGLNATAMLAPGKHTLTLRVFDTFGAQGVDTVVVDVAPGFTIGPPGHQLKYYFCSNEYETCAVGGKKYVAYGANGVFTFKAVTGSVACSNDVFGDPIPGPVKACYFANYGLDVGEGGMSVAPAAGVDVAYGANGVFNFARVSGNYFCNSGTFGGDPIVGVVKACYRVLPDYRRVAAEGGTLTGLNQTSVAYGANGSFTFKVLSGTVSCNNATFGYDPQVNVGKSCYTPLFSVGPPIAEEGGAFNWTGGMETYGSGLDGNYLQKSTFGVGPCTNAHFGGDPDPLAPKHCYGVNVIP